MDLTSYLIGRNSAGGSGGGSSGAIVKVDMSKYDEEVSGFITAITEIVNLDTSNIEYFGYMFQWFTSMENAPIIDTSNATNMESMFSSCFSLKNVPVYDTSNVETMRLTFEDCSNLTDESLDNILQMCINATNYSDEKNFLSLTYYQLYSVSKIQSLPHYQDFINAGWTIGY